MIKKSDTLTKRTYMPKIGGRKLYWICMRKNCDKYYKLLLFLVNLDLRSDMPEKLFSHYSL